jgi:hypothetical protein
VLTSRSTVRRDWCNRYGCNQERGRSACEQCVTLLSRLSIRELTLDPSNTLLIRKGVNSGRKITTRKEVGRRIGNVLLS